jgi:hypothetical protein
MLLANTEGVEELEKALEKATGCSSLEEYLAALELRDGGNGNGYAAFRDGKLKKLEKGIALKTSDAARAMGAKDYDWFLFHTREASAASVSDENCHPFHIRGNADVVAAVNGNEKSVIPLAAVVGITDSEFILRMAVQMNMPFFETLRIYESNFFGFFDGRPFVKKGNRDMLRWEKGGAIVFASDFPFGMNGLFKPEQDYVWYDGKEL